MSDNTKKLYDTAINAFNSFRRAYYQVEEWPPHPNQLVDFVAYLSYKQFSPNTVKSYISGISYFCKIRSLPDPTQAFVLKKVLVGLSRRNGRVDDRKPLSFEILSSIIHLMPTICKSTYEATLFSAIFSTAFFGYFRMGELVHNSLQDPGHAIQYGDVTYLAHNNTVHIFLRHSKTDQEGKGSSISLTPTLLPICPVRIVQSFMQARPTNPGAFFCHLSGRPVTRYQVASVFNLALKKLGLDNQSYKPHSFRIGAASAAWVSGTSAHDIASKGRWKSRCMYRYIRN